MDVPKTLKHQQHGPRKLCRNCLLLVYFEYSSFIITLIFGGEGLLCLLSLSADDGPIKGLDYHPSCDTVFSIGSDGTPFPRE